MLGPYEYINVNLTCHNNFNRQNNHMSNTNQGY